jgi:multidrug efflux system outer membrane protein
MRLILVTIVLLAGCRHYNPSTPATNIPVAWKETYPSSENYEEKNRFWELFEDPALNALEEEALSGNFDLQIAASRIDQARSLVMKDRAERLPKVDLSATLMQDETLLNPRNYGSPTNHLERVKQEQYGIFSDFSYELDLWGKLKAKQESAEHQLQATQWEREFVYQTLVTDIAIHYFSLRVFQEQIAYLEETLGVWKDKVHLRHDRVHAGLEHEIDLSKSKYELALVEKQLEQTKKGCCLEENTLAALLGRPASSFKVAPGRLPKQIPNLPAILPSEIILRRADIKRALAQVSAGRSDVNAALRSYFPSFPLTASLGLSTPLISHFFEWQARYWGYAFNALEPLFDGGKRKADVKYAKARFSEHFALYQKTVNQAFKDVEDALSTLRYNNLQLEAQTRAAAASADTYNLSEDQFKSGLISYLLVADSKNNSILVERELIALKGEQLIAWVRLMKALGLQEKK